MGRAQQRRRHREPRERVAVARPQGERLARYLLVIAAAGVVAYHNALGGPFVFDDLYGIRSNPTIRSLGSALSPPAHSAVAGRPVVNLSFALNWAIGGADVVSYHAFNIAAHVLTALALFAVVRRTLLTVRLRQRYGAVASPLAAAVAVLWVAHPLTSETVDYTVQRTELLMGLGLLATLYCAIRGLEVPERARWDVGALVAFTLGLGCKEVIVVAPVIVLAWDWLFSSLSLREMLHRRRRLYTGFALILGVGTVVVGTRLQHAFRGMVGRGVTPWDYVLTQAGVIVYYLRLALWPHPLAADYDNWPIARAITDVLPALLVVATLIALTAWGLARRHPLAFVGAWFFVILAPTSSIRPLVNEIAAERRMYLPLAAVVLLAVIGGHAALRRARASDGASAGLVAALVLVLALVTVRRNVDYRSTESFWGDIVAKQPENVRARMWLGNWLYESGKRTEALSLLTEAVALRPDNAKAQYSLGVVLASLGRTDEAIAHYREALRLDPGDASAHNNLGGILVARHETAEAIEHYREAIRLDPNHANARFNLAMALAGQGKTDESVAQLQTVVRIQPDFVAARQALDRMRSRNAAE